MIKQWIIHNDKVWFYRGYRKDYNSAGNIVRNIIYNYGNSFNDAFLFKNACKIYNPDSKVYEIYVRTER